MKNFVLTLPFLFPCLFVAAFPAPSILGIKGWFSGSPPLYGQIEESKSPDLSGDSPYYCKFKRQKVLSDPELTYFMEKVVLHRPKVPLRTQDITKVLSYASSPKKFEEYARSYVHSKPMASGYSSTQEKAAKSLLSQMFPELQATLNEEITMKKLSDQSGLIFSSKPDFILRDETGGALDYVYFRGVGSWESHSKVHQLSDNEVLVHAANAMVMGVDYIYILNPLKGKRMSVIKYRFDAADRARVRSFVNGVGNTFSREMFCHFQVKYLNMDRQSEDELDS